MDLQKILSDCVMAGGETSKPPSPPIPAHRPTGAPAPIKSVNDAHKALADLIISHPFCSQDDYARMMGYSATWVSNIIHSDAFQAYLAARKDEILDPVIRQNVEDQFKGIVARSLEVIRYHLNKPAQDVPVTVALKALETSSRAAGYGAKQEARPETNVHIHLEQMADNMTVLLRKRRETIQGEFSEAQASAADAT